MDLFLRFLILGGKYLSQLTAQSIVEAYRRSVQLGRTLNAQNTITVVSHYDSVLEMYQRNLEEFQTLPHAHLAFISEQHKQEFETYLHGSTRVSEEEFMSLCARGFTTNDEEVAEGQSFAQQIALSILGSYGKGNKNRTKFNTAACDSQENLEATTSDLHEYPPEVDYTTRDNVKSFTEFSESTANVINMFKENRQDGVLASVAEYLDRQAEYIKCANDTFKQLQVDIMNKHAQMQKEPFELKEHDQGEEIFTMKLKAVQKEVEQCTNLMKKAQDHFDVVDEDAKTKRLFQSIDKIIGDVEEITNLIQINNEHFAKCEKSKEVHEKHNQGYKNYNGARQDQLLVKAISQHIFQNTPCAQNMPKMSNLQITSIENNILDFLDRFTDQNIAKLMEANQKAFEKTEKTLKYPLIGRWLNPRKKSRKIARAKERKGKSTLPTKKFSKCSKVANARSRLLGPPLQRVSADNLPMKNFIALSSTWIKDRQHSALIGNQLMGIPSEQPDRTVVSINQAIGKYLRRERSQEVVQNRTITIVDENLDNLVEKVLTSMRNESINPESDDVIQDEYKINAFCEIKKDIDKNLQMVREQHFSVPPSEPISCDLTSMSHYATISGVEQTIQDDNSNVADTEPIMFDGAILDDLPTDFNPTVEAPSTTVECVPNKIVHQAGAFEIQQLEAARRRISEDAERLRDEKEVKRIERRKRQNQAWRLLRDSDEIQIRSVTDSPKIAQEDSNKDNTVLIKLTQGGASEVNKDSIEFSPIEIEAFAASPNESDEVRFEPMEIDIDYPDGDSKGSKVSLLISINPLMQRIENLETIVREKQKAPSRQLDYIATKKPIDDDVINASALMKDIVSEMEKKTEILEWQNNNTLFHLANEMNQNAAVKAKESNVKKAAGQQLQQLLDMDDIALEESAGIRKNENALTYNYKNKPFDILSSREQNTIDALKLVQDLIDQHKDNPRLATDVTSPRSACSFRKCRAETAKQWNKFKNSNPRNQRKSKKSYTLIKTKNAEVTLMDMINGGSRILNPTKEIYGTRKISFNNKKTVLKRLKPSPAQTVIRKESRDIKLIPMNLLKPIDRTPEEVAEITRDDHILKLNQYRTEVAKSYGKTNSVTSSPSIAGSTRPVQNIAVKESFKKVSPGLGNIPKLEKIMEVSSDVMPKEQLFVEIPNKNQLYLNNRKSEDFPRRSRQPRAYSGNFKANTKLKNIRENYQNALKKRPSFALQGNSFRPSWVSVPTDEEISTPGSSNIITKTSLNASVDAAPIIATKQPVLQDLSSNPSKHKVENWRMVKIPPVILPEVKSEVPHMDLPRFRMAADEKSSQRPKSCDFVTVYSADDYGLKEKELKKTPSEESTLTKRSKSDETLQSIESRKSDISGMEKRHLYQISPNTIVEEVHPIQNHQGRRRNRAMKEKSLNVDDFADSNTCDYDIKYKYDVPNIPVARSTGVELDPAIRDSVESAHYVDNEEARKGQTGKILIDYDGARKSYMDEQDSGRISKTAASQQDTEGDNEEMMYNNDTYRGRQHPFQARYQSSAIETSPMPPQYVNSTLSQLPKLDHIAEQILAEQETIDVKNILESSEIPTLNKAPSSPKLSKDRMSPQRTKHVKLNELDFVAPSMKSLKTIEDDRYMAPPNLKTLQMRTENTSSKDEKVNQVFNASSLNPLHIEPPAIAQSSSPRVKTHNTATAEISQPASPPKYVSACPVPHVKMQSLNVPRAPPKSKKLETKSVSEEIKFASIPTPHKTQSYRKSAKISFPVSHTYRKSAVKGIRLRKDWGSPLSDAIRQSRVRFHPDTEALSVKKLNQLSIQKMGKTKPTEKKANECEAEKVAESPPVIPNLVKRPLKSVMDVKIPEVKNIVSYKIPRMPHSDIIETADGQQDARLLSDKKVVDQIKPSAVDEKNKEHHTAMMDSYERPPNKSAVRNGAISTQSPPLAFQQKYESSSKLASDSKKARTKGNSVKLSDEISRTSIPNNAMKSLAKIEPSMNKPFVDMSSVASDMIKAGANQTYLNQLNSQIRDTAYNQMLEKCYPKEKEQAIDVQAAKVIPAIRPDPIKPKTESKSIEEIPTEVASPPRALVRMIKNEPKTQVHTKPKYTFKKSKSQAVLRSRKQHVVHPPLRLPATSRVFEPEPVDETFFTKPPPKPIRKKQMVLPKDDLLNRKEHFVAVDEMEEAEKPMPRTYGKMIMGNLEKRNSTDINKMRTNTLFITNVPSAIAKETKRTKLEIEENKIPEEEKPKPVTIQSSDMPQFIRFKSNERERNLKRLIAMDEKIKKLETKRSKVDKTIVGGVKVSKVQEPPPFRRLATNFKESSSMSRQNIKSYSNNSSKFKNKIKSKTASVSDEEGEEVDVASIKDAEVPNRVYARGNLRAVSFKKPIAQEQEVEQEEKSQKAYAMERSMDAPRWQSRDGRPQKRVSRAASVINPPSPPSTPAKAQVPKETPEMPPSFEKWKLPSARRKNALPHIPELQDVEVVVPKKAPSTLEIIPKTLLATPPTKHSPDPLQIIPPPFRPAIKSQPMSNYYVDESRYFESIEDAPDMSPRSMQTDSEIKTKKPYKLKHQKANVEDTASKHSQFDEKKTKSLKFFQKKVKQTIQDMEQKEKKKVDKEKTYVFVKKSIAPYTNTIGRHLFRLRTDADETKQKNAQDYHKALAEKLQNMSSLARIEDDSIEPSKFVYKPPLVTGGIRDAKKPSLSDVKRSIMKHLKDTTPAEKRINDHSNALV